jgi:two-component system alkaline phosphatase synthesis response regulator PhoP
MTDQKKILVVEDELSLLNLYQRILEADGYIVDTAVDGKVGFEKMQSGTYNLVLLDIMLPEMDGIQILEKVRQSGHTQNSNSVVLLTNLGQDSLVAKGLSLGIRGYLIKSDYTPDQLLKELKTYL